VWDERNDREQDVRWKFGLRSGVARPTREIANGWRNGTQYLVSVERGQLEDQTRRSE
jgi:hypothetical protein